jgi:hypothetical protein
MQRPANFSEYEARPGMSEQRIAEQMDDRDTTELLEALDVLYPLPDDDKRAERAGRTAAVVKRWMAHKTRELQEMVPRLFDALSASPAETGQCPRGENCACAIGTRHSWFESFCKERDKAAETGLSVQEVAMKCPTCESTHPHLHPAVQCEGEVQVCRDSFHDIVTPENTPERIAKRKAWCDRQTAGLSVSFDEMTKLHVAYRDALATKDDKTILSASYAVWQWALRAMEHAERNRAKTGRASDTSGEGKAGKQCEGGHTWTSSDCRFSNSEWIWLCDCGQWDRDFPSPAVDAYFAADPPPSASSAKKGGD